MNKLSIFSTGLQIGCLLIFVFLNQCLNAQSLQKVWDKRYGTTTFEDAYDLCATPDGGYIVIGSCANGINGDKTQGNQGYYDYWIVRLDADGNKVWDKRYGGSGTDEPHSIVSTSDGNFVIAGYTCSGPGPAKDDLLIGGFDYWVVKIDGNGNKLWDKNFGGIEDDFASCIIETTDGAYVVAGKSASGANGEKTEASRGLEDYWLVKMDANGNKIWDKRFGGSKTDEANALVATANGGVIVLGTTESDTISGDKTETGWGYSDCWLVKVDQNGAKVWDKRFGGNYWEEGGAITTAHGGGYVFFAQSSSSINGNKSQNSVGGSDYWAVKITENGAKVWDKCFGGNGSDYAGDIVKTPMGGYMLAGSSRSNVSGHRSEPLLGIDDFWVVQIDGVGNKLLEKRFGGDLGELCKGIVQSPDSSYAVAGWGESNISGEKSQDSRGSFDYWTVKFVINPVNQPPTMANAAFSLPENSANATNVGSVTASAGEPGQKLNYAITAGNIGGAFAINDSTGAITVATTTALNFETNPQFILTVKATDNGIPSISVTSTVTIDLTNVNESPTATNQMVSVNENRPQGAAIGTFAAVDPDAGQTLTYSITNGNSTGVFALNPATGLITVADSAQLNYELQTQFILTIVVKDNGAPQKSATATYTINLLDVTEQSISITAYYQTVNENSGTGLSIGFNVKLTGATVFPVKVDVALTGSGVYGVDYIANPVPVSGVIGLTFYYNTTYSIYLNVLNDTIYEPTDTVVLTLQNPTNTSIDAGAATRTLTINNDDYSFEKIWDKRFGGSLQEIATSILALEDGGFLFAGSSRSEDNGDKTQKSRGGDDFWIVRIDAWGDKVWDKRFGGNGWEVANTLVANADGSFIVAGQTSTQIANEDVTTVTNGSTNGWLLKIDAKGNKLWDKTFVVSNSGKVNAVKPTNDGGYILAGLGNTNNSHDFWVLKIDSVGAKIWEQYFGGTEVEAARAITSTDDGGFIIVGYSTSGISGNKTEDSRGQSDYYAVKIDANGNKVWDKRFGGDAYDDAYDILPSGDGGYFIAGSSNSNISGDVTQNKYGYYDFWVVKIDANGSKIWDKQFGSYYSEGLTSMIPSGDGNFLIGGVSNGFGYDITELPASGSVFSDSDYWIIKIDPNGVKIWDKRYGTTDYESIGALAVSGDGSVVTFGYTKGGVNGDKTEPSRGDSDYWAVKFNEYTFNQPPAANDTSFNVLENVTNGTIIGSVTATEPNGEPLLFEIVGGNLNNVAAINPASGQITVTNNAELDFETRQQLVLTVLITDNGTPKLGKYIKVILRIIDFVDGPAETKFILMSDTTVIEGKTGSRSYTFKVFSSNSTIFPVKLNVALSGKAVYSPTFDYTTLPVGTTGLIPLTFATSGVQTFVVIVNGDSLYEFDETVMMTLQTPVNTAIDSVHAIRTLTIDDDEPIVPKVWDWRFGGTDVDIPYAITKTNDGGYIMAGYSRSGVNGDKTESNKGYYDFWVVRLDSNGTKVWDKTLGGNFHEEAYSIMATDDGSFIISGYSGSGISGDKTEANCGNSYDYWYIKIDGQGNKLWDKRLGGTYSDYAYASVPVPGGRFLLGGYSQSPLSGDVSQTGFGSNDYWLTKVDSNGVKLWDKRFGGSNAEFIQKILPTYDGNYLLAGYSNSGISGNKTQANQGFYDYWVIKVDSNGTKIWDKTFGGTQDDYLNSAIETDDHGFILVGSSLSEANGDKTQPSQGSIDYWIVKIDADGNKLWDRRFGGTDNEIPRSIVAAGNGSFIIAGSTGSEANGDVSEASRGSDDYWLLKIDSSGSKIWDKRFGGWNEDVGFSIISAGTNVYVVSGYSESGISGDKTQTKQGWEDFWAVKFLDNDNIPVTPPVVPNQTFSVFENRPNGTAIGVVAASDPNPADVLSYAITGGNANGYFTINPATGHISIADSAAFDFETNSQFILTVTVTDNSVPSKSANATVTINVLDALETLSLNGGISCSGGSTGFVNLTVVDGTPPFTYLWNTGATTENLTNVAVGNYTVAVTDSGGNRVSATFSIIQIPALNAAAANPIVNAGATTTITASGAVTYKWLPGNQTTAVILVKPSVTQTYTVIGTNAAGCTSSTVVTVTVTPVISIAAPVANQTINEGNSGYQSIPLTISLNGATNFPIVVNLTPSGNASFGNTAGSDWFFTGTGVTINGLGATISFTANGSKTINCIFYGDTDLESDEKAIVTLSSQSGGVATATSSRSMYIANDDVLAASVLGFASATPSTSVFEGNSGTQLVPIQVTLSGANSFPVVAQIDYTGSSALFGNTFGKDFHLTGKLTANQLIFTANGTKSFNVVVMGDLTVEPDEFVNLNLTSPTPNIIFTDANRTITILNNDVLRLSDAQKDVVIQDNLTLYPNPNDGRFNLKITSLEEGEAQIQVIDITGRVIKLQTENLLEGANFVEFDLSNEAIGVYVLQLKMGDRLEQIRFLIK